MSRKRKLYLSEFFQRCTNKLLKVIVKTNNHEIICETILDAITYLKDTWLWDYQVKAYTIRNNEIIIALNK